MKRIARNEEEDELLERFRNSAQALVNPYWDSFVSTEQFEKLRSGKAKRLSLHSLLKPTVLDGCRSITMASANFPDTMIHLLWGGAYGVKFEEDTEITQSLRFREHQNGHLINIRYADEKPWSRKRRTSKLNPDNATIQDEITKVANAEFATAEFVWQGNKAIPDGAFDENGKRLPNLPHGLNTYSTINNIVFLSSLNPANEHLRFLKTLGIDGSQVRKAIYCSTAYQAVLRTSIRDPGNTEQKTIIVPDHQLGEYLQSLFPDSKLDKMPTSIPNDDSPKKPGRPRKHQSPRDRTAQWRHNKAKAELLSELILLNHPHSRIPEPLDYGKICDKISIESSYTNNVTHSTHATLYGDKYSKIRIL